MNSWMGTAIEEISYVGGASRTFCFIKDLLIVSIFQRIHTVGMDGCTKFSQYFRAPICTYVSKD